MNEDYLKLIGKGSKKKSIGWASKTSSGGHLGVAFMGKRVHIIWTDRGGIGEGWESRECASSRAKNLIKEFLTY
jgi:hypothetical protein